MGQPEIARSRHLLLSQLHHQLAEASETVEDGLFLTGDGAVPGRLRLAYLALYDPASYGCGQ
jgi:hypothetical protein